MSQNNNQHFYLDGVFNVKDKVALVTGGGSGIGLMVKSLFIVRRLSWRQYLNLLQCAQTLAVNGAKVYIVGRTEEKLEKVAELYGKDASGHIIPLQGDVRTKEGVV
jgi:NADP-dependent 3-hydroxy acid dehydrogenase YdfG